MKVLAVINYQKCVVVEAPDIDEGARPDFKARDAIITLADRQAGNVDLEWTYSNYYGVADEREVGNNQVQEVDGIKFSDTEWFDI